MPLALELANAIFHSTVTQLAINALLALPTEVIALLLLEEDTNHAFSLTVFAVLENALELSPRLLVLHAILLMNATLPSFAIKLAILALMVILTFLATKTAIALTTEHTPELALVQDLPQKHQHVVSLRFQ